MSVFLIGAAASVLVAFLLTLVEAAIGGSSRVAVDEAEAAGRSGARQLKEILADSAAPLSVLTFLRAGAEATAAVLVTLTMVEWVDDTWRALALSIAIMVVVTFIVVGVSPRTLGRQHSESIALAAAPAVMVLRRVLGPVARLMVLVGNAVTPGEGYRDGPFRSEAELRDLVDLAGENALIEAGERDMLHSVFELGDTTVREVMVPRTDVITIEATKTARKALALFLRSGFSRVPVVGETADEVLGLLYFKDVVRRLNGNSAAGELPVTELVRPAHFVPESKGIDTLLREMQLDQTHAVVVVDEYGGTAGLVTIEDILEEIVGEITDEHDREGPSIEDLGEGRLRVPAGMSIDDLADHLAVDLDDEDVETVGGLIGKTTGRVPIVGATCEVGGLRLTAERMGGRRHRIATVVVERVEPEPVTEEDPRGGRNGRVAHEGRVTEEAR